MRRSRDALVLHLTVLLQARQRLIEAEAAQGGRHLHAVAHQPSTTTSDVDRQLAGDVVVDGASSEPSSAHDGLPPASYRRDRRRPSSTGYFVDDSLYYQTDEDPITPVVNTEHDPEGYYPLGGGGGPAFDGRPEEEAASISAQHAYYLLAADFELCNYEDNDAVIIHDDPTHQDVSTGRLQYINANNNPMDPHRAYRDYVSGCERAPSAATVAPPSRSDPSYNVGSLVHDSEPAAAVLFGDDFYPLDEPPSSGAEEPAGTAFRWESHVYDQVYYEGEEEEVLEDQHISEAILAGRLHVPHIIEDTPAVFVFDDDELADGGGGGGFGGVPASAAAIAGLERQKYDGSGGDSSCVICMREYRKGKWLVVMPCEYKHRFHGKCLRKWLSRSHLCPLCRHPLPTEEQDGRSTARVRM